MIIYNYNERKIVVFKKVAGFFWGIIGLLILLGCVMTIGILWISALSIIFFLSSLVNYIIMKKTGDENSIFVAKIILFIATICVIAVLTVVYLILRNS